MPRREKKDEARPWTPHDAVPLSQVLRGRTQGPPRERERDLSAFIRRANNPPPLVDNTLLALRCIQRSVENIEQRLVELCVHLSNPLTSDPVKVKLDSGRMEMLFDQLASQMRKHCTTAASDSSPLYIPFRYQTDRNSNQVPRTAVKISIESDGNTPLPNVHVMDPQPGRNPLHIPVPAPAVDDLESSDDEDMVQVVDE